MTVFPTPRSIWMAALVSGALASSFAACSKTRPPASGHQGSVDGPLPQRALPALEDDPDAPGGLYEAFSAIGTVDLGRFQGAYAYPSELGSYPGLSIELNVLRSGAIPRTEIAPVRVVDRDADELLAVAVVHEDIDDPGDASLVYLLLRAEPDGGIFLSLGETATELWDPVFGDTLARVDHALPGLDYRPLDERSEIPLGLIDYQTCASPARVAIEGAFELTMASLLPVDDLFERNLRDAAYERLLGSVFIRSDGFTTITGDAKVCFLSATSDAAGVVVEFDALSADSSQQRYWARIEPTEQGMVLRFARARDALATAAPLAYRRADPSGDTSPAGADLALQRAAEAARQAAPGADPCETAFNQLVAMLDVMAADLGQPVHRPERGAFLTACRRLPGPAQQCAVSTYATDHIEACQAAFEAVPSQDMTRLQEVIQGP